LGIEYVATGHYARLSRDFIASVETRNEEYPTLPWMDGSERSPAIADAYKECRLVQAKDLWKDQTYFLSMTTVSAIYLIA